MSKMHAQKQNTQKPNKTVCAQRLTHTLSHARTHSHTPALIARTAAEPRERENKRDVLAHFAQLQRAAKQTHSNCYSSGQ